jgi:hypothetical protein
MDSAAFSGASAAKLGCFGKKIILHTLHNFTSALAIVNADQKEK